MEATSREFRVA